MLVAGVDSGTQSTKVVIVDIERGDVVAEGRAPHVVQGDGAVRESDPETWYEALATALAQTALASQVDAISIAAQQHGLVLLGKDSRPLHRAILWNDTRAAQDATDLVRALGGPGAWATTIGSVPVASFTVAKWVQMRRTDPAMTRLVSGVRLPHDYLTERLTGEAVTDRGDASGTGWWSSHSERYADAVLTLPSVDLDPACLPRVLGPWEQAGVVRPRAADDLGLRPGIIVGVGTGDNMAAALAHRPSDGAVLMSLGTSGVVCSRSASAPADATGKIAGFCDATGAFLPLACTLNCTEAVERFASWFQIDPDDISDTADVVILPFLGGERTPNLPEARGLVLGLQRSTTPREILSAAYEGAVASLTEALTAVEQAVSPRLHFDSVTLVGGGSRGKAWVHTVRRLTGLEVRVPRMMEAAAYGAAIQAVVAATSTAYGDIVSRWTPIPADTYPAVPRDDAALTRYRRALHLTDPVLRTWHG